MQTEEFAENWPLATGRWVRKAPGLTYQLLESPVGQRLPTGFGEGDAERFIGARFMPDGRCFPPEFRFCPDTGAALPAPGTAQETWIPPYGYAATPATGSRGLRQTQRALKLRGEAPADLSRAQHERELPRPGHVEFIVCPVSASADALIALDPDQGNLDLWLPASQSWVPLRHARGGRLARAGIHRETWSCEVAGQGNAARIFLPTEEGLACVSLRVLDLVFDVDYLGDGPALGGPIWWNTRVWMPLRTANGTPALIGADAEGRVADTLDLPGDLTDTWFETPVCTDNAAIWPGTAGQIVLENNTRGELVQRYIAWPGGCTPAFEFGAPYFSQQGVFWQLCWSAADGAYAYLQTGRSQPEQQKAETPRFCTGTLNYRFTERMKLPPWEEPAQGIDNHARLTIPLLESAQSATVAGFELDAPSGLKAALDSSERFQLTLVLQSDAFTDVRLLNVALPQPWKARLFVADNCLWLYHPEMPRLEGWELLP